MNELKVGQEVVLELRYPRSYEKPFIVTQIVKIGTKYFETANNAKFDKKTLEHCSKFRDEYNVFLSKESYDSCLDFNIKLKSIKEFTNSLIVFNQKNKDLIDKIHSILIENK